MNDEDKIMRQIAIILLVYITGIDIVDAQNGQCAECMYWSSDQKLEWNDFMGKSVKSSKNEAMTDSGMSISFACRDGKPDVLIRTFFDRKGSWTKDSESAYLLAHEQLHFDITELFVRKLRKRLDALGDDCQRVNSHIQDFYDRTYNEYVKYQDRYDRETRHSIDTTAQRQWQTQVWQELNELKKFRD